MNLMLVVLFACFYCANYEKLSIQWNHERPIKILFLERVFTISPNGWFSLNIFPSSHRCEE
jgi:hypothetical protein